MDLARITSLRERLWDAHFRPVAIVGVNYRIKEQAGKKPSGDDWHNRALQNPPECLRFGAVEHAPNTGILTDGLRPIDIDIDDQSLAFQARQLAIDILGEGPVRVRSNSPRCLIVYRAAEGEPRKRVLKSPNGKIEVLGWGQQFVGFGTHPSGAEIEWVPEPLYEYDRDALPAITEAKLGEYLAAVAAIIGADPEEARVNGYENHEAAEPQAEAMRVVSAMTAIPNTGPADWEAWNRVGMALWAATGGSEAGRAAWHAWSDRHPSYNADATEQRWQHYRTSPPASIGAGTLFHMAAEAARASETAPREEDYGAATDNGDEKRERRTSDAGGKERVKKNSFAFFTFSEAQFQAAHNQLVDGLLMEGAMSVVYGESNSGKTFFATDLGLRIASGMRWGDRDAESGPVLYIALEGTFGISNRIVAFRKYHGLDGKDVPFAVVTHPLNFLDRGQSSEAVLDTAKAVEDRFGAPLKLIVVDTLSRAMAGGNENAPEDMTKLIGASDKLRAFTSSHLLWVHHSGKDQAKGARGHTSLRAATDTEIEISAEGSSRIARTTKQRELECVGEFPFALKVVDIGIDTRGKVVTSCVVDGESAALGRGHAAGAASALHRLTGHNKRALEVLTDLCARSGEAGYAGVPSGCYSVPEKWWRDRFYDRAMPGDSDETKKKAFRRAATYLVNAHLVGMASKRVWLPRYGKDVEQGIDNA